LPSEIYAEDSELVRMIRIQQEGTAKAEPEEE